MGNKRQAKRPGATRELCQFYLTQTQRDAIDDVRGSLSFSAYVASAVLKEASSDGALFYGDVRGGACACADPGRGGQLCVSGEPATWWNRFTIAFFCSKCAAVLNSVEPGACLPPEELQGARRAFAPAPVAFCPRCGVKEPAPGKHFPWCDWQDVDGAKDRVRLDGFT